jgi:adenylate kinase family enzyme
MKRRRSLVFAADLQTVMQNQLPPITPSLILIGPMSAGKTTLGKLLAQRLDVPNISMDKVRFAYYAEIGYDEAHAKTLADTHGFSALYAYWKPFEAHAVERLLADHARERCIIDFGAGHSVYEDASLFRRVQRALARHRVILLLPSPDDDESMRILIQRRDAANPEAAGKPPGLNEHFLKHPSNRTLANLVVYTHGRSPEQSVDEILNKAAIPWLAPDAQR